MQSSELHNLSLFLSVLCRDASSCCSVYCRPQKFLVEMLVFVILVIAVLEVTVLFVACGHRIAVLFVDKQGIAVLSVAVPMWC